MSLLRQNLSLHPWQEDRDGRPQWVLYDAVADSHFYINEASFALLRKVRDLSEQQAQNLLSSKAEGDPAEEVLQKFLVELYRARLLTIQPPEDDASTGSPLIKLAKTYISFRVPLFSPDTLLERLLPILGALLTRRFIWLSAIVFVFGFIIALQEPQRLQTQFRSLASFQSLTTFLLALIVSKVVHEFAHGLAAKKMGARVPLFGVLFIVLYPMPYTQTSETWKFRTHANRLTVAAAGIIGELILSAWAIMIWNFLPMGPAADFLFTLSTVTILTSLLINASPFMRFDGYFILCDLLGMPNLHARAAQAGKWLLRRAVLGVEVEFPDGASTPRARRMALAYFAYATWIYRFLVFLGIALLVYHFFIKFIGVLLFVIEIAYFIVAPIARELSTWWKLRASARVGRAQIGVFLTTTILILLCFIPFRNAEYFSGYLQQGEARQIYLTEPAQLVASATSGEVIPGQSVIFDFDSPFLQFELSQSESRLRHQLVLLAARSFGGIQSDVGRASDISGAASAHAAARERIDGLDIMSDGASGYLEVVSDLSPGQFGSLGEHLATITDGDQWVVTVDLPASFVADGELLSAGKMFVWSHPQQSYALSVSSINVSPSRTVTLEQLPREVLLPVGPGSDGAVEYTSPALTAYLVVENPDTSLSSGHVFVLLKGARRTVAGTIFRRAVDIIVAEFDY